MALHRPAEFNKSHIPAFLADEQARAYVCVYPFVRSYEWYLLEDAERRRLLAEHGMMARDYPDVRANTVVVVRARRLRVDAGLRGRRADRIVDLMRHLRGSETRRHVREEVPFYTGSAPHPARADHRPALSVDVPLLMVDLDDTLRRAPAAVPCLGERVPRRARDAGEAAWTELVVEDRGGHRAAPGVPARRSPGTPGTPGRSTSWPPTTTTGWAAATG